MTRFDAKAVIGAGYGDEGKGLLTDFLAAETKDTIVVRSNGGAQAGHSVVTDDGLRHVFHHIGPGALAGVQSVGGTLLADAPAAAVSASAPVVPVVAPATPGPDGPPASSSTPPARSRVRAPT